MFIHFDFVSLMNKAHKPKSNMATTSEDVVQSTQAETERKLTEEDKTEGELTEGEPTEHTTEGKPMGEEAEEDQTEEEAEDQQRVEEMERDMAEIDLCEDYPSDTVSSQEDSDTKSETVEDFLERVPLFDWSEGVEEFILTSCAEIFKFTEEEEQLFYGDPGIESDTMISLPKNLTIAHESMNLLGFLVECKKFSKILWIYLCCHGITELDYVSQLVGRIDTTEISICVQFAKGTTDPDEEASDEEDYKSKYIWMRQVYSDPTNFAKRKLVFTEHQEFGDVMKKSREIYGGRLWPLTAVRVGDPDFPDVNINSRRMAHRGDKLLRAFVAIHEMLCEKYHEEEKPEP